MSHKSKKVKKVLTGSSTKPLVDESNSKNNVERDLRSDPHDFDYEPEKKVLLLIDEALRQSSSNESDQLKVFEDAQQQLTKLVSSDNSTNRRYSYEQVELIHKYIQRLLPSYDLYFYQCIDLFRWHPKPESTNKELANRLKELKLKQSQKYYKEISGQSKVSLKGDLQIQEIASEFKDVNRNLIAIANGFLVVVGTFVFVYKAVEYSLYNPDIPLQVLSAFLASLVVAVAELYWIFKII